MLGIAALAAAVYAVMWVGYVQSWAWVAAMDRFALEPLHRYGADHPAWVTAWNVFCTVLGPAAFRIVTLVVILIALVRRRLRTALFLFLSVELSGLITEAAKAAVDRPRPATAFVSAWGSSFPSGHALGVMVSVLALLTVGLPLVSRTIRPWLIVIGAVVVVAVGIGRVVLNVHHPSDVLAGWALGYLWFAVCVFVIPITAADETPATPDTSR